MKPRSRSSKINRKHFKSAVSVALKLNFDVFLDFNSLERKRNAAYLKTTEKGQPKLNARMKVLYSQIKASCKWKGSRVKFSNSIKIIFRKKTTNKRTFVIKNIIFSLLWKSVKTDSATAMHSALLYRSWFHRRSSACREIISVTEACGEEDVSTSLLLSKKYEFVANKSPTKDFNMSKGLKWSGRHSSWPSSYGVVRLLSGQTFKGAAAFSGFPRLAEWTFIDFRLELKVAWTNFQPHVHRIKFQITLMDPHVMYSSSPAENFPVLRPSSRISTARQLRISSKSFTHVLH